MDDIKLEEIEHTSYGDHIYAEKQTCLLEEDDTQCGHIFYNENTRLLKFYCTFCRETYDNIEYYCLHLSEHIKDNSEEINAELEPEELFKVEKEELPLVDEYQTNDNEELERSDEEEELPSQDAFEYEQPLEQILNHQYDSMPLDDFDNNNTMIIEEIEDADEIRDEVEEEMRHSMSDEDFIFVSDDKPVTATAIDCKEETNSTTNPTSTLAERTKVSKNSFEECFIKETNIDKIRSERVCVIKEKKLNSHKPMQRKRSNLSELLRFKRRRKKVTTVKVIAVKNRIAELYERIKKEQEKSQQTLSNDLLNGQQEQETQDAVESLISHELDNNAEEEDEEQRSNSSKPTTEKSKTSSECSTEVTRKIIGETLITLIPEGTKIPNKLPSPIKNVLKKDVVSDYDNSPKNINYNESNKASSATEKKAVCPACGKTFRSHFSLTIHKRIHYLESDSSVKLAHKCPDCDQLFNKLSQLKLHVETLHYPEGFICKICNRQLSSLSLLERHMVKVHLGRPFNCKKCNKNFSDPVTFEEHLASHNSDEVFKCITCGRKYSTEFFLLEHMRNHKEQVPQTCVVCGKVTLRITQHMKIHTPRPKRLLNCSVCGKVFNFSSGLSHHFKIMHKLPRPPPKPKKETNVQNIKRKRRTRTVERTGDKKKPITYNSADMPDPTAFVMDNEKFSDQIIEEQIEIPAEVYESTTTSAILNLQSKENLSNVQSSSQKYSCTDTEQIDNNKQFIRQESYSQQQEDTINHKEEEAKRVIVELIQNSTYTSFFPDNFSSVLEVTPPIAREETISAVNSIVHDDC